MDIAEGQDRKTIGILGVGNLLLSDEGFGVHFIRHLEEHYHFGDDVVMLDGGTAGIMTAPFMEASRFLFVIDTVALDAEPGSIHLFSRDEIRAGNLQSRLSPHQVGLMEVLELCRLTGKAPEQTEFITVVPQSLATGIGLSACLQGKIEEVAVLLQHRISSLPGGVGNMALQKNL